MTQAAWFAYSEFVIAVRGALAGLALSLGLFLAGAPVSGALSATVAVSSGSVSPGGEITVALDAQGFSSLGAATVDVAYDTAVLDAITCAGDPDDALDLGSCNDSYGPGKVRFTGISASGVSGDMRLALITFRAVGAAGQSSALDVQPQTFADTAGGNIPVGDVDGSVSVQGGASAPAPPPSPGPPTASPPGSTGGGDGGSGGGTGNGTGDGASGGTTPDDGSGGGGGGGQNGDEGGTPGATEETPQTGSDAGGDDSGPADSEDEGSDDGGVDWWVWLVGALAVGGACAMAAFLFLRWRRAGL